MTQHTGPLATLMGTYYPMGYVVAVIDDAAEAERASEALRRTGWAGGDVRVLAGDEVLADHRAFLEDRSPLQRVESLLASDEVDAQEEYLGEADQGRNLVTVRAETPEQVERAAGILRAHHGRLMRHYGRLVVRDLDPAT
jgi:hypothetical protein